MVGRNSLPESRSPVGQFGLILVAIVWVVSVVSLVAASLLVGPVRTHDLPGVGGSVQPTDFVEVVVPLALVTLGAIVIMRGRSHRYGWLLLTVGGLLGVQQAAQEYSLYAMYVAAGSRLPFATGAGWVQDLWMVWWPFAILLLPALFPDGRSIGRWNRPVRLAAVAWAALIVSFMLADRHLTNVFIGLPNSPANPTGILPIPETLINLIWLMLTATSIVIAVGSLVTRWRTATHDLRQQLKWVLYAFGVTTGVVTANLANTVLLEVIGVDLGVAWLLTSLIALSWVGVVVALGLGVMRYRLYEVDLVINRTLVYGAMTALVVLVYVAVVVGAVALVPALDGLGLSILATGLVAVAFNPVRRWVQRGVNRLMFGRRDDPYAVLSELGRLLAWSGTPTGTLGTMVETLGTALKLPGVAIELERDGSWERRALAGTVGNEVEMVPLRHQGEVVGRMVVARRSSEEPLHADDRRLIEDVAHHAAALVHGLRLTVALQRSREQLVQAREEERRRLRRDLHDELGPTLASQTFRLDAILESLDHDSTTTARLVKSLKDQNRELVADIRRLVYELRPPTLDELGLVGALAAHSGQLAHPAGLSVEVVTDPDPLGELPAAVEVAAYRIASEACTNVVRHASASTCTIRIALAHGTLTIEVSDNGVGVRSMTRSGVGMTSMRERAEELGGRFHVDRSGKGGTCVTASLPIATAAVAAAEPGTVADLLPSRGRRAVPSTGSRDG